MSEDLKEISGEDLEIYKFNFDNMDKAEEAFLKMGQSQDKKSISGLAKEIVCYGLRKKPEELKTFDAVKILEYFEKVMEKNADFFTRLKGKTTTSIVKSVAPELEKMTKEEIQKLIKGQSILSSQEKESVPQN
ncbi:hypothetical protein KAX02_05360 [candidate division WOR-3 bacterium]|nr:hypothetical protein [candidate division WOR-3 bacterium]